MKKFERILSDEINGNQSDFKKALQKLTKREMLDLIEYCEGQGITRRDIVNIMKVSL